MGRSQPQSAARSIPSEKALGSRAPADTRKGSPVASSLTGADAFGCSCYQRDSMV